MITILYIYKNKDLQRIQRSLDSLTYQSDNNFNVIFVDYGSEFQYSENIQSFLKKYNFVDYFFSYHQNQPWSRSKAINIGLRQVKTPFVFVADIDMIFHKEFVATLHLLKNHKKSYYFKVGFLNQKESLLAKDFGNFEIAFESGKDAQGLSLFPTNALQKIRGFDEFFHLWGSEDEDVHARLERNGISVEFFKERILMLHQWHPTYRNSLNKKLTKEIQHNRIMRINQEHFRTNNLLKKISVNDEFWGRSITQEEFIKLSEANVDIELTNKKEEIDNLFFSVLRNEQNKILDVVISEKRNPMKFRWKTKLKTSAKKILGKSVPQYYTMKEINDQLLLHVISFHQKSIYKYVVAEDLKSIRLTIQL